MAILTGGQKDSGPGGDERIAHKPPYQSLTDGERRQAVRNAGVSEDRVAAVLAGATFMVTVAS